MPRLRLGAALLLPAGASAEIDGLRRAVGDPSLGRVAPHVTLVPPVNVREADIGAALARLRAGAAAAGGPLPLTLGPPASFHPVTPVLYLGVAPGEALDALRRAVFAPPLARPVSRAFVPHVTIGDGLSEGRLDAALTALADYRLEVELDALSLLEERREGAERAWALLADERLGPPVVVGRGGLALELSIGSVADPEAARLVGRRTGLVITARREGEVVGALAGALTGLTGPTDGAARLDVLAVAPSARRQGVAGRLLDRFCAEAAAAGCASAVAGDDVAPLAPLLAARGWRPAASRLVRIL